MSTTGDRRTLASAVHGVDEKGDMNTIAESATERQEGREEEKALDTTVVV